MTVLKIFLRDIKRLITTPIALGVLLGMCALPAVYAWYCIEANWDPYDNTSGMKIAVANVDEGYHDDTLGDLTVGSQMVDALKENDVLNWQFVSKDEALEGVNSGTYYAAFVIPETFSKDFASVLSGNPVKPQVGYYVNEKRGSTAVKVADTASTTMERQINQTFADTAATAVTGKIHDAANSMNDTYNATDETLQGKLTQANNLIGQAADAIDQASDSVEKWRTSVISAQVTLGAIQQGIPKIQSSLDESNAKLRDLDKATDDFSENMTYAIANNGAMLGLAASKVAKGVSDVTLKAVQNDVPVLSSAQQAVSSADTWTDSTVDQLNNLRATSGMSADDVAKIDSAIDNLQTEQRKLKAEAGELNTAIDGINAANTAAQTAAENAGTAAEQGSEDLSNAAKGLYEQALPTMHEISNSLSDSIGALSGSLTSLNSEVNQVNNLLISVNDTLVQTQGSLDSASSSLRSTQGRLNATITDLHAIVQAAELNTTSKLLGIDSDSVGDFMASPVTIKTEKVYPLQHYGAAVAPFYCNLAIWIGCFMLIAIFKLEVDKEGFEKMTATQAYFARWLLFVIISAIQSVIICTGCIFLGMGCENPALFIISALVVSFAFVNIIFCMAIVFRHIGKALAVILLIMQIPGSSGMYPIELMPGFFQKLHPLLPFSYGITAMREAVGGLYGNAYVINLAVLFAFAFVALFIGLVVRPYLHNVNVLFDNRLADTTFMLTEYNGKVQQRYRVRNVFKAIFESDTYHESLVKRMVQFNRLYPRIVGVGQFLVFLIPLFIVFVAGFFKTGPGARIYLLMAFVLSVVIIDFLMIVIEHMRENFAAQLKMSRLKGDELVSDMMDHMPLQHSDFSADHKTRVSETMRKRKTWRVNWDELPEDYKSKKSDSAGDASDDRRTRS